MTSHSLKKLEDVLGQKGYVIDSLYAYKGHYLYLGVTSFYTGATLLLEISSPQTKDKKYIFDEDPKRKNSYNLIRQEVSETLDISDDKKTKEHYLELDGLTKVLQSEENLFQSYDRPISLTGEGKDTNEALRDLYRQTKRFSYSFRNLEYKFVMFNGPAMCVLDSTNEIWCFVSNNTRNQQRQFRLLANLSRFYGNENLNDDILAVTEQLTSLLNQKQDEHARSLHALMNYKLNLPQISNNLIKIKEINHHKLVKFQQLFRSITIEEQQIRKNLQKLDQSTEDNSDERLSAKDQYKQELESLQKLREDTIKEIHKLQTTTDNLNICTDQIFFDNLIMMSKVIKNFKLLESLV